MRIKSSVSKTTEEMPDMGTSFTMIPRAFFKDEKYSGLSPHAMILYGLMRDRSLMSEKRPAFSDSDGTYVIYSRDDICSELGCGHDKAGKVLKELQTYGLIIGKHQGRNKPNKYYVENLLPGVGISDVRKSENYITESGNTDVPEVGKQDGSYIELNNYKDFTYKEMSQSPFRFDPETVEAFLKEKVEYDTLIQRFPTKCESIRELIAIMADAVCSTSPKRRIGSEEYDRCYVRKRFLNYNYNCMEYVILSMKNSTVKVENIRAYLLAVLFNAPVTISNYYDAEVKYDLGICG